MRNYFCILVSLGLLLISLCGRAVSQTKAAEVAADPVAHVSQSFTCSANTLIPISPNALFVDAREGHTGEYKLAKRIVWADSGFQKVIPVLSVGVSYVFLVTRWSAEDKTYRLLSSTWYIYYADGSSAMQYSARASNSGLLLPYGSKSAVIIGIQLININDSLPKNSDEPAKNIALPALVVYTTSISQGTKQNISNLGALLGGLAGVATAKGITGATPIKPSVPACVQAYFVPGQPKLPFNMNVSFTLTPGTSPKSGVPKDSGSTSVINCSATTDQQPCAIARAFTGLDKEWWDVSIGINAFGTRQPKFDSSGKNPSITRNIDPYAFVTLFPLFWHFPKDAPLPVHNLDWLAIPHFDIGIPVKKQPLHRPVFGASEKIAKSEKLFGVPAYFTAGIVRLTEDVPNGQGGLRQHIAWKSMFGFEFSGSTLLSKLTGK